MIPSIFENKRRSFLNYRNCYLSLSFCLKLSKTSKSIHLRLSKIVWWFWSLYFSRCICYCICICI